MLRLLHCTSQTLLTNNWYPNTQPYKGFRIRTEKRQAEIRGHVVHSRAKQAGIYKWSSTESADKAALVSLTYRQVRTYHACTQGRTVVSRSTGDGVQDLSPDLKGTYNIIWYKPA